MASTDLRLRFDDEFDEILDELKNLAYFDDLASIAVFAAALGVSNGLRHQRIKGARDVRVQLLLNIPGAAIFMDSLALVELTGYEDPLASELTEKRLLLMEEFANGGLAVLSNMKNNGQLLAAAIPSIITQQIMTIRGNQ